jgi:signal transduction histidine kinase
VDLSALCHRAVTLSRAGLKMDDVEVRMSEPDEPVVLSADPQALLQLLMNFVSNAVDALEGAKEATLEVGYRRQGDTVELWVEDNGEGIDHETLASIFDPFFTTKSAGKGTGLGLAVVRSIADDHHATIEVESQVGTGTRFTVSFAGLGPQVDSGESSGRDQG